MVRNGRDDYVVRWQLHRNVKIHAQRLVMHEKRGMDVVAVMNKVYSNVLQGKKRVTIAVEMLERRNVYRFVAMKFDNFA